MPGGDRRCSPGRTRQTLRAGARILLPRVPSPLSLGCGPSCGNDTACSPGDKCCPRGCCARCLRAEPGKAAWGSLHQDTGATGLAAACPNRCADDRDCPGDRKCCFSGCGLACHPSCTGHLGHLF
uniref:WAP domain-containing protein n=1 Tax=Otus sunia TaxID=257818 RepID=A0A8C8A6M9_9STRI